MLDIEISGENVAMNSYGDSGAEQAAASLFDQWKGSAGHLRNMLGNFQYIGIGIVNSNRGVYGTQIFGER
jgi:uncharacterized protein YkwD